MQQYGWNTHLHSIQSHEKLTAGGMSFLDTDLAKLLEEDLPKRFGGESTHYQLVEEEGELGRPCLRLLVHPDVGPVEEHAVAEMFLRSIGTGNGIEKVIELMWSDGGFLMVERKPPLATRSGKILHLHSRGKSP